LGGSHLTVSTSHEIHPGKAPPSEALPDPRDGLLRRLEDDVSERELAKKAVHDFWSTESCGEARGLPEVSRDGYMAHSQWRYAVEPFIPAFAGFDLCRGKKVLEIGVGLGSDHQRFAEGGAVLYGVDLTERAVEHTRRRLALFGLHSDLRVADAENLPFHDNSFDIVYSYGVLHHTPDTAEAVNEVFRVLKPGGEAKIMIYHKHSFVGFMLWLRHGLLRLKPLASLRSLYAQYLESPGTKAFSVKEARTMFGEFSECRIATRLSPGDLLAEHVGQRHQGALLRVARRLWPRGVIQRLFPRLGLCMLVTVRK
jgi:ubiquinone/menaquinone biosynthesis C-methylase UbiE